MRDPPPTQSAVIVPVPAAEALIAPWRARLDPAAGCGVPAHVTVLYPFLPPARIDSAVIESLTAAISTVPHFSVTFARVEWFGRSVLWLAPEPDQPFRALTAAVWQRFTECPPYAGAHPDTRPHLTVGLGGDLSLLRDAEAGVRIGLPLHASVTQVRVICGSPGRSPWPTIAELGLGV